MPSSDPVIVLAAGRGTRMGGPKALMEVDGSPWWVRQSRALECVTERQLWVVSPDVWRTIADGAKPLVGIELVDADDRAPMFGSLLAGVRHLNRSARPSDPLEGVFVLPVDVPVPDPAVWSALRHADMPSIPDYSGRGGHPVHLPWSWITTHIDLSSPDPDGRLDTLLGGRARRVVVEDDAVVLNLNHPGDLDLFRARESRS